MRQTHHLPVELPWGSRTRAHWAMDARGTAIVFVHGFGGDAVATWQEFPRMLLDHAEVARADLIFYGYDSLRKGVAVSAAEFRAFLAHLATGPATALVNPSLPPSAHRDGAYRSERLVIVAHSMGAVVARRALLDLHRSGATWLDRVRLVLFAPAHLGASVIALASECLGAIKLPLVAVAKHLLFPALKDLTEDSIVLKQLEQHTISARRGGAAAYLVARAVVHGGRDKIVITETFCDDPVAEWEFEKGHTDVCKPNDLFDTPVTRLIEALT